MKNILVVLAITVVAGGASLGASSAQALSCLPLDMYLKDVVGKDSEVTILEGTVIDQMQEEAFTGEVLKVEAVKQGYAESTLFVYHEKSVDWGYLCNAGPAKVGDKSVYIIVRDTYGKPMVTQRLTVTDPLVETLNADIEAKEIEGSVSEITPTDRMNQIMTSINDLFKQIGILFKEYMYWKIN